MRRGHILEFLPHFCEGLFHYYFCFRCCAGAFLKALRYFAGFRSTMRNLEIDLRFPDFAATRCRHLAKVLTFSCSCCSASMSFTMSIGEAENLLVEFLQECSKVEGASNRVHCHVCGASRSLYCPDCCRILVPKEKWPDVIKGGSLTLPFHVDVILDDRRASSTGVQVATIMSESSTTSAAARKVRLFGEDQVLPDYSNEQGTFLLFPGPFSLPMSSIAKTSVINRLVVLDCRWSKTSSRMHPAIQNLQRVHLDNSFRQSYYWRWHTAGQGMISTVEAIYVSAWQVATEKGWDGNERKKLLYLLWLFGLQREVIRRRYELDGGETLPEYLPFSENGKQYQRNLRIRKDNATNA